MVLQHRVIKLGKIVIVPLSFIAWFTGLSAVHSTSLALYSAAATLNLVLVSLIMFFHTLGNEEARAMLAKVCFCCKCLKKSAPESTALVIVTPQQEMLATDAKCHDENLKSVGEDDYCIDTMIRNAVKNV